MTNQVFNILFNFGFQNDLESSIRQLEKENSRLEMGLKQESNKAEDLTRRLEESQKVGHINIYIKKMNRLYMLCFQKLFSYVIRYNKCAF